MVVKVVIDQGGIPRAKPRDARAEFMAQQYREAREAARARISWAFAALERKRQGDWIANYWGVVNVIQKFHAACGMKHHARRLKALAEVK
jgi:hypothetical protein